MKDLIEEIKKINSWKKARPLLIEVLETIEKTYKDPLRGDKDAPTAVEMSPVELEEALEKVMVAEVTPTKELAERFIRLFKADIIENMVEGETRSNQISKAGLESLNDLLSHWELTDKSIILYCPKEKTFPKRWEERLSRLGFITILTDKRIEVSLLDDYIPF